LYIPVICTYICIYLIWYDMIWYDLWYDMKYDIWYMIYGRWYMIWPHKIHHDQFEVSRHVQPCICIYINMYTSCLTHLVLIVLANISNITVYKMLQLQVVTCTHKYLVKFLLKNIHVQKMNIVIKHNSSCSNSM
jgi:hypothetical protein